MGHIQRNCSLQRQKAQSLSSKFPPNSFKPEGKSNATAPSSGGRWNHKSRSTQRKHGESNSMSVKGNGSRQAYLMNYEKTNNKNCWLIDSGAGLHMCPFKNAFESLDENYTQTLYTANAEQLYARGRGTALIQSRLPDGEIKLTEVMNCLYVPELSEGLLSVSELNKKGISVHFDEGLCEMINKDGVLVGIGKETDGVTVLDAIETNASEFSNDAEPTDVEMPEQRACVAKRNCANKDCLDLWHARFGHRDKAAIKLLFNQNLTKGLNVKDCCQNGERCPTCILAKGTRPSFSKQPSPKRTKQVMELVHSDVCGPFSTTSAGGKRYLLTFVDDFSRYCMLYFLERKDEVFDKFEGYLAHVKNRFGRAPTTFNTDNGGEFTSNAMKALLESNGIAHTLTVPHTPEMNGIAERKNRSLVEMGRCMMHQAQLHPKYWAEALATANYLQNRLPTKGASATPYELWYGQKPYVKHLRVFGSKAYTFIPKEKRSKEDLRAEEGIFVGYASGSRGYRILNPKTGRVEIRDAIYVDERPRFVPEGESPVKENQAQQPEAVYLQILGSEPDAPGDDGAIDDNTHQEPAPAEGVAVERPALRHSERPNKGVPPVKFHDVYLAKAADVQEPVTWEDVNRLSPDKKEKWMCAAQEEMDALHKNKTWKLTQLPKGKKAIGCKWIFKLKRDADGEIERYKARLVAKGYSQKYGEDYDETFAPVVNHTSIRLLLTIAAARRMQVEHLDVATAFLHGEIEEDVYMQQPPGFEQGNTNLVCKLEKSIYGLKQAARCWNQKLHQLLINQGFTQGQTERCLYSKCENKQWIYILTYVDDLIICYDNKKDCDRIVENLNREVEIKRLCDIHHYLGLQIEREDDGSFLLSQKLKIMDLLEFLRMTNANSVRTPMEVSYLGKEEGDLLPENNLYREAIGKLLYISTLTRPDIASAVGLLCRKTHSPTTKDWVAVKRVVRYLKGTADLKLKLSVSTDPKLVGYVDADYGGDKETGKSTSGNIFFYGDAAVSWASRKQDCVALSSTEAEYVSASEACRQLSWMLELLKDFGINESTPVKLLEDNQSCIRMAYSEKVNSRSKHITTKCHYIRDAVEKGLVKLEYCPTEQMTADALTKPLPADKYEYLRNEMNFVDFVH